MLKKEFCSMLFASVSPLCVAVGLALGLTQVAHGAGLWTGMTPMQSASPTLSASVSLSLSTGTTWDDLVVCLQDGGELKISDAGAVSCAPPDLFSLTPEPPSSSAQSGTATITVSTPETTPAQSNPAASGASDRTLDYHAPETCAELNGSIQTVGGGKVCSDIDISGTFCIVGSRDAFPCRGLFKRVQFCNRLNRPALNPSVCNPTCAAGQFACGAGCAQGEIAPPVRIPFAAGDYVGEVFRATVAATSGDPRFGLALASPALTLAVDGTVAAVGISLSASEDSKHAAFLQAGFSCGGLANVFGVKNFAFTVTALAPAPLSDFKVGDGFSGTFGNLSRADLPDLQFRKIGGADILTVSSSGGLSVRVAGVHSSAYEMTVGATSPNLLGELKFTVRVLFRHPALRPRPALWFEGVYDAGDILTTLDIEELSDETYHLIRGGFWFAVSPDGEVTVTRNLGLGNALGAEIEAVSPTLDETIRLTVYLVSECDAPDDWAEIRAGLSDAERRQLDNNLLDSAGDSAAQDCRNLKRGGDPVAVATQGPSPLNRGHTPLHIAAGGEDVRSVYLLIEWGANPNAETAILKTTPLMYAGIYDKFFAGLALLLRGASVNRLDISDQNAAHHLAKKHRWKRPDNTNFARLMIGAGIDLDAQQREKKSVVYLAVEHNNYELAKLFLEEGANPDLLGGVHRIGALHIAQTPKMAELILDNGGDPDLPSGRAYKGLPKGVRPLEVTEDIAIAKIIQEALDKKYEETGIRGGCRFTTPELVDINVVKESCWYPPWLYPLSQSEQAEGEDEN